LSASLDQRRSPQRGVGIGLTIVKIVVSLIHFIYCDYYLLEFSYSLVILLLSLIFILKEQSSEEFSFLLSSLLILIWF
jgi:polyferredoxin